MATQTTKAPGRIPNGSIQRPEPAKPSGPTITPGPSRGRSKGSESRLRLHGCTVRTRDEFAEGERGVMMVGGDSFPVLHYESGGAVLLFPGGSSIPVTRGPITAARLRELTGYAEVVTPTPERYPEHAWIISEGEWEQVEVVAADEDAGCMAANEVLPTTHVGGLRRVVPAEFDRRLTLGTARITAAGEEPALPLADPERFLEEEAEAVRRVPTLRRVPEAQTRREALRRLLHVRGTQWQEHTGEDWDTRRHALIQELLGFDQSSKDLDEDELSILVDWLTHELDEAGFDLKAADRAYAERQAQREHMFGSLAEAVDAKGGAA